MTDVVERFPALAGGQVERTVAVNLTTLDEWRAANGGERVDVVKIDTQGSELQVLEGAADALATVRAVEVEVEFNPLYEGVCLFGDIDRFLRSHGFVLWRLRDLAHYAAAGRGHRSTGRRDPALRRLPGPLPRRRRPALLGQRLLREGRGGRAPAGRGRAAARARRLYHQRPRLRRPGRRGPRPRPGHGAGGGPGRPRPGRFRRPSRRPPAGRAGRGQRGAGGDVDRRGRRPAIPGAGLASSPAHRPRPRALDGAGPGSVGRPSRRPAARHQGGAAVLRRDEPGHHRDALPGGQPGAGRSRPLDRGHLDPLRRHGAGRLRLGPALHPAADPHERDHPLERRPPRQQRRHRARGRPVVDRLTAPAG